MKRLETIIAENKEATEKAKLGLVEIYIAEEDGDEGVFSCPHIGDFIPDGWELVETYFVDNSGFGTEGEPALTVNQFLERVTEGRGYGITEAGQFQVYVAEFKKI